MSKILILQGPPCSGKSTWAKDFIINNPDYGYANRDTIRYRLGNSKYTLKKEKEVTDIETAEILKYIQEGKNVIIDDTNLNPATINKWKFLAASCNADIEYKRFYVPYKTALERAKKRKAEGGLYISKNTILDFYKHYFKKELEDEMTDKRVIRMPQKELPKAVICDLDATLALHQGRTPFDWSRILEDKPEPRLKQLLDLFVKNDIKILFLTGRTEDALDNTVQWIYENIHLTENQYELFLRDNKDFSHGDDYKRKVYNDFIKDKFNILCVFEDSNKCVKMFREEGLLTCQVENSDF
jgi:predicted kinase